MNRPSKRARPDAVTWLRTADGLVRWSVSPQAAGVGERIVVEMLRLGRLGSSVVESEVPLADVMVGASRGQYREFLAAFARLGQVSVIDESVVADVRFVLELTVADPRVKVPALPALDVEPPAKPHQPTAANPRAYRGTKDQPPKPRLPDPLDLRLFLLSRNGVERLAARLREVDPGFTVPFEAWEAPASLRIACGGALCLWPGWDESERQRLGELWRQLDGDSIPRLRAQLAIHTADPKGGPVAVLEFLLSTLAAPPELRDAVALGLTVDLDRWNLVSGHSHDVAELCGLGFGTSEEGARQAGVWTRTLVRYDVSDSQRIIGGARLSLLLGQDPGVGGGRVPNEEDNELILALLESLGSTVHWTGMRLWHRAAESWDVTRILRMLRKACDAEQVSQATLRSILGLTCSIDSEDNVDYVEDQLERALPAVLKAMEAAGEEREAEAMWILKRMTWWRPSKLSRVAVAIDRWCREPFSLGKDGSEFVEVLASASDEGWARLLAAEDETMLGVQAECSGSDDAFSTSVALAAAMEVDEAWSITQFIERPRLFLRLLRTLSLMKSAAVKAHLRRCRAEFAEPDFLGMNLEGIAASLSALPLPSGAQPLPKKVRLALSGEQTMTSGQVERARQQLIAAWPDCVLQAIRQRALESMAKDLLPGESDLSAEQLESLSADMSHAIQFQASVEDNRRALRRLLRAVFEGDEEYLNTHPRNVRWNEELARRVSPEAAATWANLPSLQRTLPKAGPVELAVETRPLEALRMGTYVGSCLGLGRSFSYTAAAVVLDGNKQVVFARSETGQFLARQIIGISEEWTLCCYLVYPEQNGSPLSAVFREYNEQLSRTLGIPLAGEDDDVEKLIATAVFDDGIWLAENGGPEHAKGAATPG